MMVQMWFRCSLLAGLVLLCGRSPAQTASTLPFLEIRKTTESIVVDGVMSEAAWEEATVAKGFQQHYPYDTAAAAMLTEVRMTYDAHFIYVAAVCYDPAPGRYVVESLKRDFDLEGSDNFTIYLDPFQDKLNGFAFAVNPYGAQWEGMIEGAGMRNVANTWDNIWYAAVVTGTDRWVVEMAIPFKTIRYKEGLTSWGLNFSRTNYKNTERSVWSPVPRNFSISHLGYAGSLRWDASPKKAGTNVNIIPYAIGETSRNYLEGGNRENTPNGGLDAKIAVTSSLNLDLTVNPDFSQVDVDRQVTNLTQFSLFFPEKRTFFLENSDLFTQYGFRQIRPFFSRRIGLYNGERIPIYAGARLSGKLNKDWRIGAMNMHTARTDALDLPSQNYTVLSAQYQVMGESNIAAIVVNRQAFEEGKMDVNDFNRIAGLEFRYVSKDNRVRGKIFQHHSINPRHLSNSFSNAVWLLYSTRHINAEYNHEYVGRNYLADVGFVPRIYYYNPKLDSVIRKPYLRFEPILAYTFFPKSRIINRIKPELYVSTYHDTAMAIMESQYKLGTNILFQKTSEATVAFQKRTNRLYFPTNITGTADSLPEFLPTGYYTYYDGEIAFISNRSRRFLYQGAMAYGSFFNGTKFSLSAEVNYRKQPWGVFSLNYTRDVVNFPDPYKDAVLDLVGPRIEISFTKSLFISNFIQYNTQANNVNINARLQWRFRPMSDLFIVYTDNYFPTGFTVKNRALVMKLVWWLAV